MIKKIIKSNPIFFTIWFHLYRRHRGVKINFFTRKTVLCIDGYPRSGNTFSLFLIRNLWPEAQIVHHFHAVAALKIAKSKNIPTFILVRDPLNTVSSWYLKSYVLKNKAIDINEINLAYLKNLLKEYITYNHFIIKKFQPSEIILFDDLIKNPAEVMYRVNEKAIPEDMKYESDRLSTRVDEIKNKSFGTKDKLGSSLPNKEKESAKEKIQHHLTTLDLYNNANKIYNQIKSLQVNRLA